MTIGIGMLCMAGRCIWLSADTRATYDTPSIASNDACGKLFALPHAFYASIAGDVGWAGALVSELHHRMERLRPRDLVLERVKKEVQDARFHIYTWLADEALRTSLGITFDQWKYDKALRKEVHEEAAAVVRATMIPVEIIVAGFCGEWPVLLCADNNNGIREDASLGYFAIGSGAVIAINSLNRHGQNPHLSVQRSLYHLAMARMHCLQEKTVGSRAEGVLLSRELKSVGEVGADNFIELLKEWWDLVGDARDTQELDSEKEHTRFLEALAMEALGHH